jgi:hypothetical protein
LVCNIILLSRQVLRCGLQWVAEMKFLYQIRTVDKMVSWLPRTFARAVSFPVNQVKEFPSKDLRVENLVNLIFSFIFYYHRWWWVLLASWDCVWRVGFEERYMENIVNLHGCR